jgi:DNA mismatch repair protein MutL
MSEIKLLPKNVVEQIAAGEVIERPSSIVKELLENAIDSGADKISVFFDNGGISRIKIIDNGSGINGNQLLLAITPHATSKITSAEDLYAVSTMGFRGEALASIASACKFTLSSSVTNDGGGFKIASVGGEISQIEPIAHIKGTSVECLDLFFNLPARKKFLKSEKSEKMSILSVVEQVFIAFPTIHFSCFADGKKLYDVPAVDNHKLRISQLAGTEFANDLIYCRNENNDMSCEIYICSPLGAKQKPKYQNLYVNLRKIDNTAVSMAVRESFSRFVSAYGNKPSWFCFLDIEPNKIDVNVHPTKQTIKFDDEKTLFSFIYRSVFNELENYQRKSLNPLQYIQNNTYSQQENQKGDFLFREPQESQYKLIVNTKFSESEEKPQQISMPLLSIVSNDDSNTSSGMNFDGNIWETVSCFQIHNKYIAVSVSDGLLLIDQHAAHERVLYEKFLDSMESGIECQSLIFPITMELKPYEKETLLSVRELFMKAGFDIKDFGGNTIAVHSMPTDFSRESQIKVAIEDMVAQFLRENNSAILSSEHRHFAASYACGAAIKFGYELKNQEMNSLLTSLFSTKNPHICPHGRPTFSKISLNEIAKRFLR